MTIALRLATDAVAKVGPKFGHIALQRDAFLSWCIPIAAKPEKFSVIHAAKRNCVHAR